MVAGRERHITNAAPTTVGRGSVIDVGIWVKRLAQIHSGWWTTRWQHHVTRWTWKSKWSYKLIAGCGYAFVRCWRWILCVLVLPTTWVLGARFDQLASHQCKTFGCWTVRAKFSASGRLHLCVLLKHRQESFHSHGRWYAKANIAVAKTWQSSTSGLVRLLRRIAQCQHSLAEAVRAMVHWLVLNVCLFF